ncbi:MAG: LCP family protein [Patescibacteria group bacterium]|nr:LCP family protein [Patescibacteria group bacterium]
MVVRKKDLKSRSRTRRRIPKIVEETTPKREVHVLKKRSGFKRGLGITFVVLVLLALGWFATKLALSGWNVQPQTLWQDLFSFGSTTLVGEEDGRINVAVLGNPGGGDEVDGPNLTDTLIVASLDTTGMGQSFMFSLPRDLYVRVPGFGNSKINTVYKIGNSRDDSGGELISQVLEDITGLEIPYFVRLDFDGFEKLIDELGGITVTVDQDLYDDQYPNENKGYEVLDIKTGTYTMDGVMALKFARSRQSTSDFDRARRQQKVILAIKEKAGDLDILNSPAKALAILDIVADHFEANLGLSETKRFMTLFKDMDFGSTITKVFDDSPSGLLYGTRVDEIYVLRPVGDNPRVISDYVEKVVSEKTDPEELDAEIQTEPLKVEVLNGTNITGLAGKTAATLETLGYDIVDIGNSATRGFETTIVYDLTDSDRIWEVRKLAEELDAEIGTDEVTTDTGAMVRVVLGSDASN